MDTGLAVNSSVERSADEDEEGERGGECTMSCRKDGRRGPEAGESADGGCAPASAGFSNVGDGGRKLEVW